MVGTENKKLVVIFGILLLAFVLRVLWLPHNLFFGFEQGRDLLAVHGIVNLEDLRLIGPKTDLDGVFHGALSYYLLVPLFIIAGGDPFWIIVFLIALNVLSIVFLYKAIYLLLGKKVALFSTIFYALSYSSIIYSRWLSNPNLIPALAIGIFYSLVKARSDSRFLVLTAGLWAVVFHLSLASAATLLLPILLFVFLYRINISIRVLILSLATILLILSPYVLFELRHNFILTQGLQKFIQTNTSVVDKWGAFDQFSNELVDNFFPSNRKIALFSFLGTLVAAFWFGKRNKASLVSLLFLFLPPFFFFVLGIRPLRHIYITTPIFLSIIIAIAISNLVEKKRYLGYILFIVVVLGNLWAIMALLPESKSNFLQRSQRTYLGDEKRIIDYVYQDTKGQSFSYDYYSIPYWKKEAWEYLFLWYGQSKYGYLPKEERTEIFYVLIEPDEGQPLYQKNWYEGLDKDSILVSSFTSGKLKVEKREIKK